MDTKKALLTIIIVLAFALIAASLGQLTGYTIDNTPSTITITPNSISPGDTIKITLKPREDIKEELVIYKLPSMIRVAVLDLDCEGFKCPRGEYISTTYKTSLLTQQAEYAIKSFNIKGEESGSGRYTII